MEQVRSLESLVNDVIAEIPDFPIFVMTSSSALII